MAESAGGSGLGRSFSSSMSDSARQRYLQSMMAGIMEMGMGGENSDVDIIVEGQSFPCHKLLLAAGSPYFKSMFSSGFLETTSNTLELPDIEKATFEAFRTYIYTGQENISRDNVVELLRAAALFQVQALQESCEEFLSKEMDTENCLEIFKLARQFGCNILLDKCRPYVMEGFNGLWKTKEFDELDMDDILSIVRDDDLVPVDEEQICEAVLRWVKADEQNRVKDIAKLFRHVRLINISPEYLLSELYQEKLLIEDDDCLQILDEARDYHMLPARQQEFCSSRFHLRSSDDFEEVTMVITEYDMERSGSFYQDAKCLWAFSFNQNRWYTLAPIPMDQNPGLDFQVVTFKCDLYLAGGTNHSKNLLHYDSERNEWNLCEAQMKRGRSCHVMAAVRESIYIIGGKNPKAKEGKNVLGSIEEYSIRGRKWRTMGELVTPVHSAASTVIGELIYIFGGIDQNGQFVKTIQAFEVRTRECKVVGHLDLEQPVHVSSFGHLNFIVNAKGDIAKFNIVKKDGDYQAKFQSLMKLSPSYLPLLGFTHYRGRILLLSATEKKKDVFSQMIQINMRKSPMRVESVTPRNHTKPKPIHACLRNIINKQFLYHTYYQ